MSSPCNPKIQPPKSLDLLLGKVCQVHQCSRNSFRREAFPLRACSLERLSRRRSQQQLESMELDQRDWPVEAVVKVSVRLEQVETVYSMTSRRRTGGWNEASQTNNRFEITHLMTSLLIPTSSIIISHQIPEIQILIHFLQFQFLIMIRSTRSCDRQKKSIATFISRKIIQTLSQFFQKINIISSFLIILWIFPIDV